MEFSFISACNIRSRVLQSICRIYYIEEPIFYVAADEYSDVIQDNVHVITIYLKGDHHDTLVDERQQRIISNIFITNKVKDYILWYYTAIRN